MIGMVRDRACAVRPPARCRDDQARNGDADMWAAGRTVQELLDQFERRHGGLTPRRQ